MAEPAAPFVGDPPRAAEAQPDATTRRWRAITLYTLLIGYVGYYICRSNLSVGAPLMLEEFGSAGVTKEHIGSVASFGVLFYAIGKVGNGLLADLLGGRRLFLLGAAASVVCTVLFGLVPGAGAFVLFFAIWAANRYAQSMGWVGMINVSTRWFPVERHATVMGVLSMSYLAGDAFARLYLGQSIALGLGWRGLFFLAAGTLAVIACVNVFTVRATPAEVGAQEPPANPENVYGEEGNAPEWPGLRPILAPVLRSTTFWVIAAMNFGLTLIRETFNLWTPTYLFETAGLDPGAAAITSLLFPLVGAIAAALGGVASDRVGGKHGRVLVPSLIGLGALLLTLGAAPVEGNAPLALAFICAVSFCLLIPYSFCSGVMALDLGGKRGAATVAGLIDGAGYTGGMLSGWGVGALAERMGWPAAFTTLGGVAVATLVAGLVYWWKQERAARCA